MTFFTPSIVSHMTAPADQKSAVNLSDRRHLADIDFRRAAVPRSRLRCARISNVLRRIVKSRAGPAGGAEQILPIRYAIPLKGQLPVSASAVPSSYPSEFACSRRMPRHPRQIKLTQPRMWGTAPIARRSPPRAPTPPTAPARPLATDWNITMSACTPVQCQDAARRRPGAPLVALGRQIRTASARAAIAAPHRPPTRNFACRSSPGAPAAHHRRRHLQGDQHRASRVEQNHVQRIR